MDGIAEEDVDIVGFAVDADDPWLIVNGVLLSHQLSAVVAEVRR